MPPDPQQKSPGSRSTKNDASSTAAEGVDTARLPPASKPEYLDRGL